jgi:hypothetical protein
MIVAGAAPATVMIVRHAEKPPGNGKGQRSLQTLQPLAARLEQRVLTTFSVGEEAKLGAELRKRTGATLLAWEHGTIPEIVAHLGAVDPAPPKQWPDSRFDVVWALTRAGAGWTFHQVPQLLLAGDSPDPI